MATKDSKAQLEVWEWKEKAYQEVKDMPLDQAIDYIVKQAKETAAELDRRRKRWKKR